MISVIVPVYKVEDEIVRCVESVQRQSYFDWELILVDDGSPDRSGEICEELALSDSRIRVFHKENGGASSARNIGLEHALGEWIVFVDGDDVINPDYLNAISINKGYDFLVFGMAIDRFDSDGNLTESSSKLISKELRIECQQVGLVFACLFRSLNMDSSCAKAYRKSIIDKYRLRFNEKMICYEDFDFVIRYLSYCKGRLCSLPYIAYHYIQGTDYNPIRRRNNRDLSPSIMILIKTIHNWIQPENLEGDNKDAYFYLIAAKYGLILNQIKFKRFKEVNKILTYIVHNEFFCKYRDIIISHSTFVNRLILKLNIPLLRYGAYFLNRIMR